MIHRDARYVAAAVQGIVGWEWLVSGTNKVLSGSFPSGLTGILQDGIKTNPNSWYVAFLQGVILPHSLIFGYLIEVAEVLAGALVLVGGIRHRDEPQYRLAVAQIVAAALAALICAFLCVNFHFFMGDGVLPGLNPATPSTKALTSTRSCRQWRWSFCSSISTCLARWAAFLSIRFRAGSSCACERGFTMYVPPRRTPLVAPRFNASC
ncbi:MAG TPA: hypothetical protein VKT52_09900 [Ktedonobacterales bacterium]|nr:hypothetical protein [Ktedonobacterales bacterium]